MNRKLIIIGIFFFLFFLIFSGCLENLGFTNNTTTYEAHPTSVGYKISYGFYVNITGSGNYNILYNCDKPDRYITTSLGSLEKLYPNDYVEKNIYNNSIIFWNISREQEKNYKLGISSTIESESYIISDLKGTNAEDIGDIKNNYQDVYDRYTKKQNIDDTIYIDPDDSEIKNIAEKILDDYGPNSFIVAKKLFIWLKNNTSYEISTSSNDVKTASQTFKDKKGDCDDLSFLFISLCRSVGIPSRFIRGYHVEYDEGTIHVEPHAWVEVFVGENIGINGWIPVECAGISNGNNGIKNQVYQNFGVESVEHLRVYIDDGTDESLNFSISGPLVKYENGLSIKMSSFVDIEDYTIFKQEKLYIDEDENRFYKNN